MDILNHAAEFRTLGVHPSRLRLLARATRWSDRRANVWPIGAGRWSGTIPICCRSQHSHDTAFSRWRNSMYRRTMVR